ncbi:hypothetical protein D3C73_1123460 [compost metagenome]
MRHDDQPLHTAITDPQGLAGLQLPLAHGQQAAPVDLGDVRRFTEHQGDQASRVGIGQHHAGGGERLRQVVDEDQQHQQWQAAEEPDVEAGAVPDPAARGLPRQGQEKAEDNAQYPGLKA